MAKIILIGIIIFGFLLRFIWLNQYPNGFTADEAQQGYSAYSILKTGRDEWGVKFPIFPRGFGDYKAPLYTYLTIPTVFLLGLNEFAVRLPAVLIGTTMILVVYLLATELFSFNVGIWSAFLLAISPWAIQLSRTAFEGGLGMLPFSLGLWLYLKSKKNNLLLPIAFLLFGLNLYSYHSWRLFTVLFVVALIISDLAKEKLNKKWLVSLLIFGIFMTPILLNLKTVFKRSEVSIFSQQKIEEYFKTKATSSLPLPLARFLDNKFTYIFDHFSTNYLSYFSPTFLFSGSRPDSSYLNFPKTPLMYLPELIFVYFGVFLLLLKKEAHKKIIFAWILLGPVAAASTDSFNAHRGVTLLPLTVILSAYGLSMIFSKLNLKFLSYFKWILSLVFILSLSFFLYTYLYELPRHPSGNLRYGYKEVFLRAISLEDQYDSIIFSKAFSMPQIFIAFYTQMDPLYYQKSSQDWLRYEKADKLYIDQLESYNLGKYKIQDLKWENDKKHKNDLLVSYPIDFPEEVKSILDVQNPKGDIIYRLIATKDNQKK